MKRHTQDVVSSTDGSDCDVRTGGSTSNERHADLGNALPYDSHDQSASSGTESLSRCSHRYVRCDITAPSFLMRSYKGQQHVYTLLIHRMTKH